MKKYGFLSLICLISASTFASTKEGKGDGATYFVRKPEDGKVNVVHLPDKVLSVISQNQNFRNLQTHVMRYPQMFNHWMVRNRDLPTRRVLLLGAGLRGGVIPQLHELQAAFPNAEIVVIDNDESIGKHLSVSDYDRLRIHGYGMLNWEKNFDNGELNKDWKPLVEQRKKRHLEALKLVPRKLDLRKIRFIHGDFADLDKLLEGEFDVIVGTLSVMYPLSAHDTSFADHLLTTLISHQTEGTGEMYLDAKTNQLLEYLLDIPSNEEGFLQIDNFQFTKKTLPLWTTFINIGTQEILVEKGGVVSKKMASEAVPMIGYHDKEEGMMSTDKVVVFRRWENWAPAGG